MKFTSAIAFLAVIVAVTAAPSETNAKRMARGLPPRAPIIHDRATPVNRTSLTCNFFLGHLLTCNTLSQTLRGACHRVHHHGNREANEHLVSDIPEMVSICSLIIVILQRSYGRTSTSAVSLLLLGAFRLRQLFIHRLIVVVQWTSIFSLPHRCHLRIDNCST